MMQINSTKNRIVITGIGIITSLGKGIDENFHSIINGKTGIKKINYFNTIPFKSDLYSYILEFDIDAEFTLIEQRRLDRCYKLLEIAAKDAINDAKLLTDEISSSKTGIFAWFNYGRR